MSTKTINKKPEYKNSYRNVKIDCESSDGQSRYNNTDDEESIFVFGNEALALQDINIDCESSDGLSRHDNIEAVKPEQVQEDINSPAKGHKRFTEITFQRIKTARLNDIDILLRSYSKVHNN